ncbi:acyl-CoA dehydrogenase family protein [Parvularcula marina]|uniref:Pimeloyl-CoA dehydrogenase small subunit n=1 Tax=Parvularcula marina TaxID=2292771 RepID=A0A371RLE7_9PROT|nr:acyl-CoA dehydrogenase [Parvularcula marina]RFB06277.1 pimeloyl-CoA dehydrogenase small subunit [Parvularcula marina]
MTLVLDTEQELLKDSVERLVRERYGFAERLRLARDGAWSRPFWGLLADQGLLGIGFSEDAGGLGEDGISAMLVAEALGRGLCLEPYLETVIVPSAALAAAGDAHHAMIEDIITGKKIVAPVFNRLSAEEEGKGVRLSGHARHVTHGDDADLLLVTAEGSDGRIHAGFVETLGDGVICRRYTGFDGRGAAEITFENVHIGAENMLATPEGGGRIAEHMEQAAIASLSAEASGIMAAVLDLTVEQLRTRQQFGQPLASFQSLQHRLAEMAIELEQTRSMANYAAHLTQSDDVDERRAGFAAIKGVVSASARFVGQQAVQLHGGLGVSEEHQIGWAHKRLTMIDMQFGGAAEQYSRLASLGGLGAN